MMKIDAVITWVDGNDPVHRDKRRRYAGNGVLSASDKAADTRFTSLGEIFWCVASLNRYAPWINKIYIVTDEQDPGLEEFINRYFPESAIPVEVVDHKVIFRGYTQYLPTFNSISIETMTWRIPGLSDHFIEFNDDLVLMQPVSPEDFFTEDGKVIVYGSRSSVLWDRFTRLFKGRTAGARKVTTKESQMNGAMIAGAGLWYIRPAHCQKALRRDFYERFYSAHEDLMVRNISCRFRDAAQFLSQTLQYMSLYKQGLCELRPSQKEVFFMQPKDNDRYFVRKMIQLDEFKGKFACFNSVDMLTEGQRRQLIEWIENKLNIKL